MEMTYLSQPPKRYTFEQPKLKKWVEGFCHGHILNLFAGKVILDNSDGTFLEYRNDIDPDMPATFHRDAFDLVAGWKMIPMSPVQVVILDPPYNIRKAREKYEGRWIGKLTKIKNILPSILARHGYVISLGYDTVGMSKSRGFEKIAVCVVCHGGDHNDTLVVVERKL
jgi:hypothetical protein